MCKYLISKLKEPVNPKINTVNMQTANIAKTVLRLLIFCIPAFTIAQEAGKHRVVVLSDIEADPDDAQSLVRFLLYSNQWDVEGLIATTSIHQKTRVAPESIDKILLAYNKVQPNLLKHEKGYLTYEQLKPTVKKGLPGCLYNFDCQQQKIPSHLHWSR